MRPLLIAIMWIVPLIGFTQQDSTQWTLRKCIDYARENNIRIQSALIAEQGAETDYLQAKAQRFPSLNFSTSQNVDHQKTEKPDGSFGSNSAYSGNYSLNLGLTLYNGGKLSNTIRYQSVMRQNRAMETAVANDDVEIAVTQAYLQILYANESLKTAEQTVESSTALLERAKELHNAGSISVSDYAQVESQYSSDRYLLTVAQNALSQSILTLKQLLELELEDDFHPAFPTVENSQVMTLLPALGDVYRKATEVMPGIAGSRLNIEAAELGEKNAAASRLPTVSLNAGINTGHNSGSGFNFTQQLDHKLNQSAGISIAIPIYNNRQHKSSIEKARQQKETAQLDYSGAIKDLLKTVESLYLDATSAQSRYASALSKQNSSALSYKLVSEQFNAGMKNTVELLTEKNNFLAAQQELIQAKYEAVLSVKLLDFYQDIPISI